MSDETYCKGLAIFGCIYIAVAVLSVVGSFIYSFF